MAQTIAKDGLHHCWMACCGHTAEKHPTWEKVMEIVGATPLLLSILVGFLLGLVTVGLLRLRCSPTDGDFPKSSDALLLGLLALAAFALGVFLTDVLFGILL
jgi:hypothetical protein